MDIEKIVAEYFQEVERSIHKLSHMNEGNMSRLPLWTIVPRVITIGRIHDTDWLLFRIDPDSSLESDTIHLIEVNTSEGILDIIRPIIYDGAKIGNPPSGPGRWYGTIDLLDQENPYILDHTIVNGIRGWCQASESKQFLSTISARKDALDFWNDTLVPDGVDVSFPRYVSNVLSRFGHLIKLKSFREHRVHRFLNNHAHILLPDFRNCYFEQRLTIQGNLQYVADFILDTGQLSPAIMIELESPCSKPFKANGELTAYANHAKAQISDWARVIAENPENTQCKMSFLRNPENRRMVVMGRGLEHIEDMRKTVYTDTIVWTYDFLLQEAKARWTSFYTNECEKLGIPNPPTF